MGGKSTGKKVEWFFVLLGLALLVLGAMYMFGAFLHKTSDVGLTLLPALMPKLAPKQAPKQAQQE